jgi:autoinducer 2-degrading protein
MFAVVVTFQVNAADLEQFLPLMHQNAEQSLRDEPECHQFDVCTDPARPNEVFLYELYSDAAAFQQHLSMPHFKQFDTAVAPMIAAKDVRTFAEVAQ